MSNLESIHECPTCGRVWCVELRDNGSSPRLGTPHSPADESPAPTYHGHCYGTPERVKRDDVEAAYLLGGREAGEALVTMQLAKSILAYEQECKRLFQTQSFDPPEDSMLGDYEPSVRTTR